MTADEYDAMSGMDFKIIKKDDGLYLKYFYSRSKDLPSNPSFEVKWLEGIDEEYKELKSQPVPGSQVKKIKADPHDLWFWTFEQKLDGGGQYMRVLTLLENDVLADDTFSLSPPPNVTNVKKEIIIPAPRLDEGITRLTTVHGTKKHLSGSFTRDNLKDVLEHIHGRLKAGPSRAWLGESRNFKESWFRYELSEDADQKADERWSRTAAEMLTFFPYSAPFAVMILDSDGPVFTKMQDEKDPAYPVVSACQQLVTMATIMRGFRYKVVNGRAINTFDASKVGSSAAMEHVGGQWYDQKAYAIRPTKDVLCGPCSLLVFNTGRHIGFISRTMEIGDAGLLQTFDTGALGCRPAAGDEGIHEDPWRRKSLKDLSVGYIPPQPSATSCDKKESDRCEQVTDLNKAIGHIRNARPLGFARLVIVGPGQEKDPYEVLFASPLLRMHRSEPGLNFTPASYLWSLRQLPYKESIQALWLIYIPVYDLAYAMLEPECRTKTVKELLDWAVARFKSSPPPPKKKENYPDQSTYPAGDKALPLHRWITNVLYLYSEKDTPEQNGCAYVLATRNNDPDKGTFNFSGIRDQKLFNFISDREKSGAFPWGRASGTLAGQAGSGFAGLEYFFEGTPAANAVFSFGSMAFNDGEAVPGEYTCKGKNVSPPLAWENAPPGSKSFAVIMDDLDASFVHWVLYDVPGTAAGLDEGAGEKDKVKLDNGAGQGKNDFGSVGYGGPCPPPGNPHNYMFTVYALDKVLALPGGQNRETVMKAMGGHVLASAKFRGLYPKK